MSAASALEVSEALLEALEEGNLRGVAEQIALRGDALAQIDPENSPALVRLRALDRKIQGAVRVLLAEGREELRTLRALRGRLSRHRPQRRGARFVETRA